MAGSTDRVADVDSSLTSSITTTVSGIEFTVSVLMPASPQFVSQISFVANEVMNGRDLICIGLTTGSAVQEMTTLQVISGSKRLQLCLLVLVQLP